MTEVIVHLVVGSIITTEYNIYINYSDNIYYIILTMHVPWAGTYTTLLPTVPNILFPKPLVKRITRAVYSVSQR